MTLNLAGRRIFPDVIMTFHIKPHGDGWKYSTPRGAMRFKHASPNARAKYAWIGKKRDTLLYAFDLREAVQQAAGRIWLTTEFDLFAMRSAGIYHAVAALQGEGSVPDELPISLGDLGVTVCHIAPDRDDQGAAWAQIVADKLTAVGIAVHATELPFPHTPKSGGDIGRLWQAYTDPQPFEQYLLNLPVARLEGKSARNSKICGKYIIPDIRKEQIALALGVTRYNSRGFSENIRCPFHDDTTPSAGLHRERGLKCFRCGWKRWKDLAEVLGVEWAPTGPAPLPQAFGLGDELIQAMVRAGYTVLAHMLDTAFRAGWTPGEPITIRRLAGLSISEKRARKAFAQMEGREWDRRKHNGPGKRETGRTGFPPDLTTFFLYPEEELIPGRNSKRGRAEGRRGKVKAMPNPEALARAFGAKVTRYTRISPKPNLADWRAEVYALPIDNDPGSYSREELCKPLGISKTTSQAYDRRAKIEVTHRFAPRVRVLSADELPDTPVLKATWLETDDGRQFSATKAGYVRADRHGGRVWKVRQLANEYRRRRVTP